MTEPIVFTLPLLLPTPNQSLRLHWSKRRKHIRDIAWQAKILMLGKIPAEPFARARVRVWRHGITPLDPDAITASAKMLLDVLQPQSRRHPYGLGVIANDDAASLELSVQWIKAARRVDQRTVVEVAAL